MGTSQLIIAGQPLAAQRHWLAVRAVDSNCLNVEKPSTTRRRFGTLPRMTMPSFIPGLELSRRFY